MIGTRQLNRMRHEIIRSRNIIAMHEEHLLSIEDILNKKKRKGGR